MGGLRLSPVPDHVVIGYVTGGPVRVACRNCGHPVIRKMRSPTGWTHYDRQAVWGGWQGMRCPGAITGAVPPDDSA